MSDFASMRVRREVLAHAHALEEALRRRGYERLPADLHQLAREGNLSAITDVAFHLLARELDVDLANGVTKRKNGAHGT